ncbi:SDR family oxidoreductase [Patescibacteria group bacterium]
MKIFVTGGDGLIGSRFLDLLPKNYKSVAPNEKELDITNREGVSNFFEKEKPEIVVHFAALTDPKKAELERDDKNGLAWMVNVEGTKYLVRESKKHNSFFIYISTDLIFPSTKTKEEYYDEDSQPARDSKEISWYAWTKLEGEKIVLKELKNYAIIRFAYPFRTQDHENIDFARLFLHMYDTNTMYPYFTDNTITPTYIDDACEAIFRIIDKKVTGIFHVMGSSSCSHYDYAKYLYEKTGRDSNKCEKTLMSEFLKKSRVPRSLYSTIKSEKTAKALGMRFKTWQEGADTFLDQYKSSK